MAVVALARQHVVLVAATVAAVVWPFVLPPYTHFYGVLTVVYALVALSLTVLSGWTGQISLGHAAFLGTGVYATQPLLARGVPLPFVVVLVAGFGAALSLVLGIPSLRLKGVYLTIVTLSFGAACELFFFPLEAVSGGSRAKTIARPDVLGLSLGSDRSLYLAGLVVAAAAFAVCARIRASDVGRSLLAIRDSEDGAQSLGIRIAPYKIGAFALSAALASMSGVFYGLLVNATPAGNQFGILQSMFLLALPVIGGLESLLGALIGGAVLAIAQPVVNALGVRLYLTSGILLAAILLARTGGIVGLNRRLLGVLPALLQPGESRSAPAHRPPQLRVVMRRGVTPGTTVRLRVRSTD